MSRYRVAAPVAGGVGFFLVVLILGVGAESGAHACSYGEPEDSIYMDVQVAGGASCGEVMDDVFYADEEQPSQWDCAGRPVSREGADLFRVSCRKGEASVKYTVP